MLVQIIIYYIVSYSFLFSYIFFPFLNSLERYYHIYKCYLASLNDLHKKKVFQMVNQNLGVSRRVLRGLDGHFRPYFINFTTYIHIHILEHWKYLIEASYKQ